MSIQSHSGRLHASNHPNAHQPNSPHSALLPENPQGHNQINWVATMVDGHYYLTDPQSIDKLKMIQAELEKERQRLAHLQIQPDDNASFLSYQQKLEKGSNKSAAKTEFNMNKDMVKRQTAEGELVEQEEKYRSKIIEMEKKRHMKKAEVQQKAQEQLQPESNHNKQPSRKKSSVKPSQKQPKVSNGELKQASHLQPSAKPSRKVKPESSVKPSRKDNNQSRNQQSKNQQKNQNSQHIKEKSSRKMQSIVQGTQSKRNQEKMQQNQKEVSVKASQRKSSFKKSEKSHKKTSKQASQHHQTTQYQVIVNQVQQQSEHIVSQVPEKALETGSKHKKSTRSKQIQSSELDIQQSQSQHNAQKSNKRSEKHSVRESNKEQAQAKSHRSHKHSQKQSSKKGSNIINVGKLNEALDQASSVILKEKEESMNASSHNQMNILSKQLQPQQNDQPPTQINMKKKKQVLQQSEKKSRSFVIHSRHGSVKQRSQKQSRSKFSSRNSRQQLEQSMGSDTATKLQLAKLHQKIGQLQEKLKKVQQRQEMMQKQQQSNASRIQSHSSLGSKLQPISTPIQHQEQAQHTNEHIIQGEPQQNTVNRSFKQESVKQHSGALQSLQQMAGVLKMQPKLSFQSSIIQVNTVQQRKKKREQQEELNEKQRLKGQIVRLKRIIRDMQIQKIRSIDNQNELGESGMYRVQDSRNLQKEENESKQLGKDSRHIQKDLIHSMQVATTRRRFWAGSNASQRRIMDDVGKILKNGSPQKGSNVSPFIASPNKRPQIRNEDEQSLPSQMPFSSTKKDRQRCYNEIRKGQTMNRLEDNDKEFHNFIQSSRVFGNQHASSRPDLMETQPNFNSNPFGQLSQGLGSAIGQMSRMGQVPAKINYSRLVQQMKKNNPEQQQILPQINIRDIKMPNLPQPPTAQMNQDDLLALAKKTYQLFGVNIEENYQQLCVKKYKNCVIFTVNNSQAQCILWHFSGKFYMGGWKSGQPAEGQKHGQGLQFLPDKHLYKGQFLNGKKHGTGILKTMTGNLYDGQWIQGVKNGRGVYLDAATKVVYSGDWRDGKKDGHGFLKLLQKQYYYGTFVQSIKQGFGVQMFVNGDKYKGEYYGGKFHGKGKYMWANGSCYQGQFHQGVRQGQGSWKSAKNNGDIYIGSYDGDKKNGYGRYVWANGCMYQGGFANDLKHGKGRLTYQDGKEIKGVWEEGNLLSTQNDKKQVNHQEEPLRRSVKVNSFGVPSSLRRN